MKAIRFLLICAAITLSVAAACGMLPQVLYGKRIAGQVMDADTGQPVSRGARRIRVGVHDHPERLHRTQLAHDLLPRGSDDDRRAGTIPD